MAQDCSLCSFPFDLNERMPKRLQCGHTYCRECIATMIRSAYVAPCPMNCGNDNRDLQDIPSDINIVQYLERNMLQCYVHGQPAIGYNLSSYQPVCSECTIRSDLPQDSLSPAIAKQLFLEYTKHKKSLSKEIQEIVKIYSKRVLKLNVEAIRMITQFTATEFNCANHPTASAISIDVLSFKFHCQNCSQESDFHVNPADPYSYLVFYVNQILSRPENVKFIYSTVARGLSSQIDLNQISRPYLELMQMANNRLTSPEQIGCQNCGKLYHLGPRMPLKLRCGHLICYKCSKSAASCSICRVPCVQDSGTFQPIEGLYEVPRCCHCENNPITLVLPGSGAVANNLPFHNFCNCITCVQCIRMGLLCNKCNTDNIVKVEYYHKLHRRSMKALMYLNVAQKCGRCGVEQGVYWQKNAFQVFCNNCVSDNDVIPLTELYLLDCFLMQYDEWDRLLQGDVPMYFLFFASLPILLKMKIITSTAYATPLNKTFSCGQVYELRRFSCVYPVTKDDHRAFRATDEYVNLTIATSRAIKVIAVILAGRRNLQKIVQEICYTSDARNNVKKEVEVSCKEDIIFLEDIPGSNYFSIFVKYPIGMEFFSGKFNLNTIMMSEGNKFEFSDAGKSGYEFCGPILGLLYTEEF